MKRIAKIVIKYLFDDSPDLSYIGKYTDDYNDWVIDRREGEYVYCLRQPIPDCAKCQRETEEQEEPTQCREHEYVPPSRGREYNFFKPYACGEKEGTEDYQKYGKQDYRRMESLNQGGYYYIGIRAEATVQVSFDGGKVWKFDTMTSGGLWGIESDSDPSYLDEVAKEELNELKATLIEYGFSETEIDAATTGELETVRE
jgi:hypothetical protein